MTDLEQEELRLLRQLFRQLSFYTLAMKAFRWIAPYTALLELRKFYKESINAKPVTGMVIFHECPTENKCCKTTNCPSDVCLWHFDCALKNQISFQPYKPHQETKLEKTKQ